MKNRINPLVGIIALVIVVAVVLFTGYRLFLQPTPNEPVDASPYTKAFNEKMKKAFAKQGGTGGMPQQTPMQSSR